MALKFQFKITGEEGMPFYVGVHPALSYISEKCFDKTID